MEMQIEQSKHAEQRAQQRGWKRLESELLDLYGDDVYVGRGCYRVAIPVSRLQKLVREEVITPQQADKLKKRFKIQSGEVDVTVANSVGSTMKNYKYWKNGKPCMWYRGKRVMSLGKYE